MSSKKVFATLGVLAAVALSPAPAAHAASHGTQVGSEGVRSSQADGIIAILIGVRLEPTSLEYPNLVF
jgi:hypothetical protein